MRGEGRCSVFLYKSVTNCMYEFEVPTRRPARADRAPVPRPAPLARRGFRQPPLGFHVARRGTLEKHKEDDNAQ